MRSMTGFGRGEAGGTLPVVVEVRSVNHRYLDLTLRVPREYAILEERLRGLARQFVRRGRVELTVTPGAATPGPKAVFVDFALASQYHKALRELAEALGVPYAPDARQLAALPGVCALTEGQRDVEGDWPAVAEAARAAMTALAEAREREGRVLAADLAQRADAVLGLVDAVAARLPAAREEHYERARARLGEFLGASSGDALPSVLADLVERADVTEELVRLRSHLRQFRECLDAEEPVGRRLEFLAQECHREWTTIAAKAVDVRIAEWAVEARVLVEQLREQVQNVE